MPLKDALAAIIVAIIWGLNMSLSKIAVAAFPPFLLSSLRFFCVALLLIWFAPVERRQLPRIMLISFTLGTLHFAAAFYGLQAVDASLVAILMLTGVPFSVVFARMFLREKVRVQQMIGIAVAFCGLLVLFDEPTTLSSPFHITITIFSAAAWAASNILIKGLGNISSTSLNAWLAIFAAPQLLLLSFLLEKGQGVALSAANANAWSSLAYIVVMSSIVGYGLWYKLVGKHDVGMVVPFSLLVPVVGVIGGVVMLGEDLNINKVIGGLIILTGVIIIQFRRAWFKLLHHTN